MALQHSPLKDSHGSDLCDVQIFESNLKPRVLDEIPEFRLGIQVSLPRHPKYRSNRKSYYNFYGKFRSYLLPLLSWLLELTSYYHNRYLGQCNRYFGGLSRIEAFFARMPPVGALLICGGCYHPCLLSSKHG